jgi:hypothetical protein
VVIRLCVKRLITVRCFMDESWSAVPEWIQKAEADWEVVQTLSGTGTTTLRRCRNHCNKLILIGVGMKTS